MTKVVTTTEARARFTELLGRVEYAGETFTISRNGRAVATLAPATTSKGQMSVRELLYLRLVAEFGEPSDETTYVHRWILSPRLHLVAEKRGQHGKLWTPWFGTRKLPHFAEEIPPSRRVNSNVYSGSPILAGGHLTQFPVASDADIDTVIAWLRYIARTTAKKKR